MCHDAIMELPHDTGYYVTLAARAFKRVAEARMRPLGLGVAHMPVLIALSENGALTQRDIAQRTHIEQPTAAALLQRMEAAGWIERSPDPRDRRASRISLSATARAVLPKALRLRQDSIAAATAGLSAAEVEQLQDLLGRVLDNLDAMVDAQVDVGTGT